MDDRWRGWANAEIYDRFVREHHIYDWLNERLVEQAEIEGSHRVLDLGCGTGATTRACLARVAMDGEVIGLDGSAEMIAVAEAQVTDPRAHFVVAQASEAADVVSGTFERAVSNAAFWQFPGPERVLAALGRLLTPGGLFVFNLPAERIAGHEPPFHPFQMALASAIADVSGQPFVRTTAPFDVEVLRRQAAAANLTLERTEELVYEGLQGELIELMEIPALIEPLTVELDAEAVRQVLARARAAVDPKERVKVPWVYLRLRRE